MRNYLIKIRILKTVFFYILSKSYCCQDYHIQHNKLRD